MDVFRFEEKKEGTSNLVKLISFTDYNVKIVQTKKRIIINNQKQNKTLRVKILKLHSHFCGKEAF